MMKKLLLTIMLPCAALVGHAQGGNTGMGGEDGDYQSLAERLAKVEKKHNMLDVYINFATSAQAEENGGTWQSRFANKDLRLELKGKLTDKIFYRFRHRLNRRNDAKGVDKFSKATDIMMVGYHLSHKVTLMGGKMAQAYGGYEYDANPMYVHQYSDMLDHMSIFQTGAAVSIRPLSSQELVLMVSNNDNATLDEELGENAYKVGSSGYEQLEQAKNPLALMVNWNGNFLDDQLQTRWAWGIQKVASGNYARLLTLGQRLNLPKVQWELDYMGSFDDMDHLGIATDDVADFLQPTIYYADGFYTEFIYQPPYYYSMNLHCGKTHYNTWITKLDWQFAPQWNLMLKGTYETVSLPQSDRFNDYRKSIGLQGALEYYPDKTQDLRVFLAYWGKHVHFSDKSLLANRHTNRLELGLMYRIKCY